MKYMLFDSMTYLLFETVLTVAYCISMILLMLKHETLICGKSDKKINRDSESLESMFILIFAIDMIIKIVFHVNGYRTLKV